MFTDGWKIMVLVLVVACQGGEDSDEVAEEENEGCGEITTWDVVVHGKVVDANDSPLEAIEIQLEDRAWNEGDILGTATSDASGEFELEAIGVTSVENCWGTVLSYYIVGQTGELSGEKGLNTQLFNAIDDGSLSVDFSEFPLVLE